MMNLMEKIRAMVPNLKEVFLIRETDAYSQDQMDWQEISREYAVPAEKFTKLCREESLGEPGRWKFWIHDVDALEAVPPKFTNGSHKNGSYFFFLGGDGSVEPSTEWEYEQDTKTQERMKRVNLGSE